MKTLHSLAGGEPGQRGLAVLLAALAVLSPLGIDIYLPAIPAIATGLAFEAGSAQQTISAYLVGMASMLLIHGALSDALGRRPVILTATLCYAFASAAAAFMPSATGLVVARFVQGVTAGAGTVVGRALIRDRFEGAAAQRLLAMVALMFGIAPLIAPVIGGWLAQLLGWRSVFYFLSGYALLIWFVAEHFLPETLPVDKRVPLALAALARRCAAIAVDPRFLMLAGAISLGANGLFLYVVSTPMFLERVFLLQPSQYGWFYIPIVVAMMAGTRTSAYLAARWPAAKTVTVALAGALLAAFITAAVRNPSNVGVLLAPLALYAYCVALAMPGLTLSALNLFPASRGLTSSLVGLAMVVGNAATAGFSARLEGDLQALSGSMIGLAFAAAVGWLAFVSARPGRTRVEEA